MLRGEVSRKQYHYYFYSIVLIRSRGCKPGAEGEVREQSNKLKAVESADGAAIQASVHREQIATCEEMMQVPSHAAGKLSTQIIAY